MLCTAFHIVYIVSLNASLKISFSTDNKEVACFSFSFNIFGVNGEMSWSSEFTQWYGGPMHRHGSRQGTLPTHFLLYSLNIHKDHFEPFQQTTNSLAERRQKAASWNSETQTTQSDLHTLSYHIPPSDIFAMNYNAPWMPWRSYTQMISIVFASASCVSLSALPIFVLNFSSVEHLLGARRGYRSNFMPQ